MIVRARADPVEQLGHRVLEQRQRAGLVDDVGDDAGHEAGLERGAHPFGRFDDGSFELVGGERCDGHRPGFDERGEIRVAQRPVVEVGPERRASPAAAIGRR